MLELMEEVYLWEQHIPDTLDVRYEFDEFEFFEKLCYRKEDRWSFLTDDVQTLLEGGEGVETTFGYSLAFGTFSNTDNYFAIVQYVYPDTPAWEAGITRGSIFIKINDKSITEDNYTDLFYAPSLSVTLGELRESTIYEKGKLSLTARKQSLNPVIASSIIQNGGRKIGYICYTDFFGGSHELFFPVFQAFKNAGVTDVVLDLRYNLGGYLSAAKALVGTVCPVGCLDGKTILITKTWNDFYNDYWRKKNRDDMLHEYFPKVSEVPVNLNLSRIVILTGRNTASASELTICGLEPYMQVTKVGGVTRGKYTAAMVFSPDKGTQIDNWGTQAIVYKYANANNVTEFKDGFRPDYSVEDVLLGDVKALGDPTELLLAKALSLLGVPAPAPVPAEAALFVPEVFFNYDFHTRPKGLHNHLIDFL
jgi:C-terminal processing protease CtpA/Prc